MSRTQYVLSFCNSHAGNRSRPAQGWDRSIDPTAPRNESKAVPRHHEIHLLRVYVGRFNRTKDVKGVYENRQGWVQQEQACAPGRSGSSSLLGFAVAGASVALKYTPPNSMSSFALSSLHPKNAATESHNGPARLFAGKVQYVHQAERKETEHTGGERGA